MYTCSTKVTYTNEYAVAIASTITMNLSPAQDISIRLCLCFTTHSIVHISFKLICG